MTVIETWKDIAGYEGLYQVSNNGRVRSVNRMINGNMGCSWLRKGQILSPYIDRFGYEKVTLCDSQSSVHKLVHRLVAQAFIPNPCNYSQINHKDEDKCNNNIDNLEWCSPKYNSNYGSRKDRLSKRLKQVKVGKPIAQYSLNGDFIRTYKNAEEAASVNNFWRTNISACCCGSKKTAHGYMWKFI